MIEVLLALASLFVVVSACKMIFFGDGSPASRGRSRRRDGLGRRLTRALVTYGVFRWLRRRDERREQRRDTAPPTTGDQSLPPPLRRRS